MVIDDELTNLVVLQEGLKDRFEVVISDSASEAFELLQQGEIPTLILLDLVMPGQDGLSFCRQLKAHPVYQHIPVIFLTARDDNATECACLESGAVDFIRKPFNLPVVAARISHHVSVQRLIRGNAAANQRLKMVLHELRSLKLELDRLSRDFDYAEASKFLYEGAFVAASEGLAIMDGSGNLLAGNPALARIIGTPLIECLGHDFLEPGGLLDADLDRATIVSSLSGGDRWQGEFRCRRPNGEVYTQRRRVSVLRNRHGVCQNLIAIVRDLSGVRQTNGDTDFCEYRDPVTGLADRAAFLERLSDDIKRATIDGHSGAVLVLDIKDFKTINQIHGHVAGDAVLMGVSDCLAKRCDREDLIARLGADQFAVLLGRPGLSADQARFLARSLVVQISRDMLAPVELAGLCRVSVQLRTGIAVFPDIDASSAPAILQLAEAANHSARHSGQEMAFYRSSGKGDSTGAGSLERELLGAIDREQIVLFAQGQHTAEGECRGYEVLARWQHPEKGLLRPDRFIPQAEKTRLVVTLERHILQRAFEVFGLAGEKASHLTCSVNVSARHLSEPDFVDVISSLITRTGADPSRIVLELTETVTADDLGQVSRKMTALEKLGIRFSLDDFGTGYSSLSRLHRLPISEIKIDRGFVNDAPDNPASGRIVNMISHIGQSLGLDVVAEGIETQEHQQFFAEHYPHIRLQSFYYGSPCPLEQFLIQL